MNERWTERREDDAGGQSMEGGQSAEGGPSTERQARSRSAPLIPVPGPEASLAELDDFALTYNGYTVHRDLGTVARIAKQVEQEWNEGRLTTDVDRLRTTLFYHQRWGHWDEYAPTLPERPVVVAVMAQLRLVAPEGVVRMERI